MRCSLSIAMSPYPIESRDEIFVIGYGFWPYINSKTFSGQYSQKLLDHAK